MSAATVTGGEKMKGTPARNRTPVMAAVGCGVVNVSSPD